MMCARSRSRLSRSTTVRCVVTGISRAAPSSVAFSTSQSIRARLTGANASQTSGIVSGSRVRRSTVERHALLARLGDPRQPLAARPVEQRAARRRPSSAAHCRDNWPAPRRARPARRHRAPSSRTGAAGFWAARRGSRAWARLSWRRSSSLWLASSLRLARDSAVQARSPGRIAAEAWLQEVGSADPMS